MRRNPFSAIICTIILASSITACSLAEIPSASPSDPIILTPEEVAENFYTWYLDHFEMPLENSPDVTQAFIDQVKRVKASFPEQGGGADPILWAQDFPQSLSVEGCPAPDPYACAVVHLIYDPNRPHDLTLELVQEDGAWKINNIQKGNPLTPDGTTELFFRWYLNHANTRGSPLAGSALSQSPYLTGRFKTSLEQMAGASDIAAFDPIVQGGVLPQGVSVYAPTTTGEEANVLVEFFGYPPESPAQQKLVRVFLQRKDGAWLIDSISGKAFEKITPDPGASRPLSEWQTFMDEESQVSFLYPPGWVLKGEDSSPSFRHFVLLPQNIAEAFDLRVSQGTSLDRTLPPAAAPFGLDIVEAGPEGLEALYPPITETEPATYNGYPAEIQRLVNGRLRFVFEHPGHPRLWLVFQDFVSQDPRYEFQAKAVEGVLEIILASIQFHGEH